MSELPENLIQQLRAGDGKGYEKLYELYYERVYALAYGILQNSADAQDAVQQTFIRVFQKITTLKDDTAFNGWLMKIAQNESLKLFKSRKPSISIDDCTEAELSEPNDDDRMLPEEALAHKETCRILHECIETLSPEQREAMTLFYFHEMKVKEIADLMDCSEATVKTRLFYARRHIADAWESHEGVKARRFSGVMLPVGEIFARLLRQETEQKRPKAAAWKGIIPALYTSDSAGMAAGTTSGSALAVRIAAGVMASMIAAACIAGFAAIGGDDGKAGNFYGGFGKGQQEAQSSTVSPAYPTYPYEPINVPQNQSQWMQPIVQNNANNVTPVNEQQQPEDLQELSAPAPTQPENQNNVSPAEETQNRQQETQNRQEATQPQQETQDKTVDFSLFAGKYINRNNGITELTLNKDGTFLGKTPNSSPVYNEKTEEYLYIPDNAVASFYGVLKSYTKMDEYDYALDVDYIVYTYKDGYETKVSPTESIYALLPGKPYTEEESEKQNYFIDVYIGELFMGTSGRLEKKGLDFYSIQPVYRASDWGIDKDDDPYYHIPNFIADD